MPTERIPRRQTGLALVIVIWILTLLSVMAGSFALTMRRESSVSAALTGNARALALAESGLNLAASMLRQPEPEQRWQADGSIYRLAGSESELRIRIMAESGKVDINAAGEELLTAVLSYATADENRQQQLLDAIIDWRDADDEPRPEGAEKKQYRQAGRPYPPGNAPFQSLEELQLVLGMDDELFERIRPWLTVYSGQAEPNKDLAPPELLSVIDARLKKQNIHDVYLERRLAKQTGDSRLDGDQADAGLADQEQTFTIICETLLADQAAASLSAVVKFENQDTSQAPYRVLDWQQGRQESSLFDPEKEPQLITVQDEFTNNY